MRCIPTKVSFPLHKIFIFGVYGSGVFTSRNGLRNGKLRTNFGIIDGILYDAT